MYKYTLYINKFIFDLFWLQTRNMSHFKKVLITLTNCTQIIKIIQPACEIMILATMNLIVRTKKEYRKWERRLLWQSNKAWWYWTQHNIVYSKNTKLWFMDMTLVLTDMECVKFVQSKKSRIKDKTTYILIVYVNAKSYVHVQFLEQPPIFLAFSYLQQILNFIGKKTC